MAPTHHKYSNLFPIMSHSSYPPTPSSFLPSHSHMANQRVCLFSLFLCLLSVISALDGNIFLPSQLVDDDSLSSSTTSCPATDPNLYYRPVIGILSHPGDGASGRLSNATGVSYIAASYVKFVESGGARVIPLIYNESPEILKKVFYKWHKSQWFYLKSYLSIKILNKS